MFPSSSKLKQPHMEVVDSSLCSRSTVAFVAALGTFALGTLAMYGPGAATAPPTMQQQPQPPQQRGDLHGIYALSDFKHARMRPHARHKHVAARTQPSNGDVFSEEESAVIRKAAEDPTSMFDMSTP